MSIDRVAPLLVQVLPPALQAASESPRL